MKETEEFRSSLHRIFELPSIYEGFQTFVGAPRVKETTLKHALGSDENLSFLDLGCGTGEILRHLKSHQIKTYTGIDINPLYIEKAKAQFDGPNRAFHCCEIQKIDGILPGEKFDVIYMGGFIHHLNDHDSLELLKFVAKLLSPRGRVALHDPVLNSRQTRLARMVTSMDRGKYVREEDQYTQLLKNCFKTVEAHSYPALLRIPYTIQVTVCRN